MYKVEALGLRGFNYESPYVASELMRVIYRLEVRLGGIERILGMILCRLLDRIGRASRRRYAHPATTPDPSPRSNRAPSTV